ncbi:shikimate kinase [Weissella tructae]|uniref:Shikimate kinase n=2 Tax=Weissella TaxID=46255 RepID=A0A075TZQ3_9LACO|nr:MULTISPECIES: shikimate kinase [Weissella]AIG65766.1 Shikimate kinase [Weissella tructae]AIM63145.1 Shikimate kinase [Weissella ceti]AIM64481.1 Shikimate kinase [Weissella ceti]ELA06781.1 shikimate kinase [Weissella ceti NC36]
MKLILIGFMGAGKTTTAELLSQQLDVPMWDTDVMLTKATRQTPSEIFATQGETVFRKLEQDILRKSLNENGVLATGGGVIEKAENRVLLKNTMIPVYYLSGSFGQTMERIVDDTDRPILQTNSLAAVGELWRERLPKYTEAADITIHTDNKTPQAIVDEILAHHRAHYE